jgi:hypothetical protein
MLNQLSVPDAGGKKKSLNVGSKGGSAGLEDYVYSDDGGESCGPTPTSVGPREGDWRNCTSRTLHKLRGAGLTQGLLVRRGRVRLHVRRQGSSAYAL